jgi:hypothetical protein
VRSTHLTWSRSATLPPRSRAIWNPLFHHDKHRDDDAVYAAAADGDDAVDARDCFLLGRRLAESGLLSVVATDQIDRLGIEARAKTTGFRSALRQLDGVMNVLSCRRRGGTRISLR